MQAPFPPVLTRRPVLAPSFTEHPVTVLLVDDQPFIQRIVERMLQDEGDITFHYCRDPEQAVATALEVEPTVILQDLAMPRVDGLELVSRFRAEPATAAVPLIVLSAEEEPRIKARAFELGANDYLVKLPNRLEFVARVRYHSTAYSNLLQRDEAYQALLASQRRLADELAEAAAYVRSMLPPPSGGRVSTTWAYTPSSTLGGDAFDTLWIDDTHLAIYILDVSGHGVGAALLSVSVLTMLRTGTLPGVDVRDPDAVLRELNAAFPMEGQNGMYFTMWYGVYDASTGTLSYASAGHPPALHITPGAPPQWLGEAGLPVGFFPDASYPVGRCSVAPDDRLYLYSDGAYEILQPHGERVGLEAFSHLVAKAVCREHPGLSVPERVFAAVQDRGARSTLADDFSLLEVRFDA